MTVPSSYVIIFSVIVLIAILTWFIPAIKHATLGMTLMAPIHGFKNGVSVILFILIIGGYLRIVNETKSLEVGIGSIVKRLEGREVWMIPVIMFIISLGGTTYGLSDEALPIYPLLISAMLACGFDSVTATATILCGIISGVSGSTINPFSISAAIDALKETGIQPNQGIILGMGTVVWLSSYLISCLYTMRYALRVKKDPSRSVQSAAERQQAMEIFGKETEAAENMELTPAMKKTLKLFGLSFAIMILGLVPWQAYQIHCFDGWSAFLTGTPLGKWYFNELCVWFLVMSFVIGFFNHFDSRKIMKLFVAGAGDLVGAALIVGLSRGVSAIMKDTGFQYLFAAGGDPGPFWSAQCAVFFPFLYLLQWFHFPDYLDFRPCFSNHSDHGSFDPFPGLCTGSDDHHLYCSSPYRWSHSHFRNDHGSTECLQNRIYYLGQILRKTFPDHFVMESPADRGGHGGVLTFADRFTQIDFPKRMTFGI